MACGVTRRSDAQSWLQGAWSRRIADERRLVHHVVDHDLVILQARYHY